MMFTQKIKSWSISGYFKKHLKKILYFLLFVFNCFLVLSKLTPDLLSINPHDGAKYIESGRLLLEWGLRDLAWGPLVAFIYASIHLIVGKSADWFILEAWTGNVILYGLLWFGFLHLARQLKAFISEYVFIGLLFSSIVFIPTIENQSDALFVFFSVMALVNLNQFRNQGKLKYLILSSFLVGLGVLCRSETVLLILPLFFFSLIFNRKRNGLLKVVLGCILPASLVLAIFILTSLLTLGTTNLGLGSKSYNSFQMNQAFLPGSRWEQAYLSGEDIFGSYEENQGSVFKAVLNNPLVVGERILANILKIPDYFMAFFGNLQAPVIFLFSLIGIWCLIKEKESDLLWLLLIWPAHALVALIFLPRHVIPQISYAFLILAAIGVTYFLSFEFSKLSRWILFGVNSVVLVYSVITTNKILFSASLLVTLVSLISLVIRMSLSGTGSLKYLPAVLLLIGMLFYGNNFVFPAKRVGKSDREQAVHVLQEALPDQSNVLASVPIIPVASKQNQIGLPVDTSTIGDFIAVIEEKNIQAVYLDDMHKFPSDIVTATIQQCPNYFEKIYESGNGTVKVYLVKFPDQ